MGGSHLSRTPEKIVIVVDDESQVRESLVSLLKSAEFRAVAFSSAEEALQSAILAQASCVITDVRMPGMHGLDLQDRIKRQYPQLPVLFITGHRDEQVRRSALSNGALGFLYKPIDPDALLRTIESAIGDSRNGI